MNTHKNARLTFIRRQEMVADVLEHRMGWAEAAYQHGVSIQTVRKWVGRFLADGREGLQDKSSRPHVSPRAIPPSQALAIVELRRKRLPQARLAKVLQVSPATVSRVLARAGLSRMSDLDAPIPVVRYEHAAPGDLLHIDIKTLGRIEGIGPRITGRKRDACRGAGHESVFVAVDDHSRIAFTQIHPDEKQECATAFLQDAVAYYASLGVTIRRLITDNGSAFRSKAFANTCAALGIRHRFTRPYRPQTNGKAERFIQSALREWAYGFVYQHSDQRAAMMKHWLHHYNWHRPHHGIGAKPPISRLKIGNNLLKDDS